MKRLVDLVKLDRLDNLVRRQATGTPEQLSKRLGLSRSSLFDFIAFLRDEMQAPIRYSKCLQSYIYEYLPKFHLGFERDRLQVVELNDTYGGIDRSTGYSIDRDDDVDDIVLDDDINFNDLYLDDNY
jgi:hypothetical protein